MNFSEHKVENLRPLDSSRVHNSHGGGDRLPPLPCRLWTDQIYHLHHLIWVWVIEKHMQTYLIVSFQILWLKESEPEPLLHLDHLLFGEMATNHQRNLWQHHNQLHQLAAWTNETKISQIHVGRGTAFSSCRGEWFLSKLIYLFDPFGTFEIWNSLIFRGH